MGRRTGKPFRSFTLSIRKYVHGFRPPKYGEKNKYYYSKRNIREIVGKNQGEP